MTDDRKLPILKPQEMVRVVEKMGFIRTKKSKGGHLRYCHPDGRKTSIPMHKGEDIGRGLLRKILKDIDIEVEELRKHI